MRQTNEVLFTDVGHMIELVLFGYVIQYAYSDNLPHPFAIDEIIGASSESIKYGKILTLSSPFLAMIIDDEGSSIGYDDAEITKEMLLLAPSSDFIFQQRSRGIVFGRSYEPFLDSDFEDIEYAE